MALLTSESNIHHIPKPNKNIKLEDYIGAKIEIDSDHAYGYVKIGSNKYKISSHNFIHAGSIIKSDSVYIWITACGQDKKNKLSNKKQQKYSRIDQFIGKYMMNVSVILLVSMIIIISFIKTIILGQFDILTYLLYCVQNWILFNGIIPFSVKIFLILARNVEAYYCSKQYIGINDSLQIDDFGKIKKIVCDKTGTVTKNELEFVKLIVAGTTNILDINNFSIEEHTIPTKVYECLGLCIHQSNEDFATIEDKIIRAGYQSLGAQCFENDTEIELDINDTKTKFNYVEVNGLDFTFDRKMSSKIVTDALGNYYIYCKGSLDTIYQKINESQREDLLRRTEKIICHKYPELMLLAFAYKKLNDQEISNISENINIHLFENNLIYLGIIGIKDTIQPDVEMTVNNLRRYGINCSLCTRGNNNKLCLLLLTRARE